LGENPTAIFYISQRDNYKEFTNGRIAKKKKPNQKNKKAMNV
jgi:hypothetical protein